MDRKIGNRVRPKQKFRTQHLEQQQHSQTKVVPIKDKSCGGVVRGSLGLSGLIEVNYLEMDLSSMPEQAYHYDVNITPDRPKKLLRFAFEQFKREVLPNIAAVAFDGSKNCYTIERLQGLPMDVNVQVPDGNGRIKTFRVEIKETNDVIVDLSSLRDYSTKRVFDKPMRALQVLDIIISALYYERGIRMGRSYFCRANEPGDLQHGYEALTGLFQSSVLGEQPLLNVDIVHKSFPRPSSLIEYLKGQRINPSYTLPEDLFGNVQNFLKGLDIEYRPPVCFGSTPKKYRVLDLDTFSSAALRFRMDDGMETTVAAYYESKGYSLQFPKLNCIKVGSTVRSIHLPMELCSLVEGQVRNRKDAKRQTEEMCRFAAISTNERKAKTMKLLQYYSPNDSAILRGFGIRIGTEFIKVSCRTLPAPSIEYFNGQTVCVKGGKWYMDGKRFLTTSQAGQMGHKWVILYENLEQKYKNSLHFNDVEEFRKNILKISQGVGLNLSSDRKIIPYANKRQLEDILKELSRKSIALAFVIVGTKTSYEHIKQFSELKMGILTQCLDDWTVRSQRKRNDATVLGNLLLKVNGKLNGTNHKIAQDQDTGLVKLMEPLQRVMFLGADVTHPSPDQRFIPSVVGVVASHDCHGDVYNHQYRLHKSKQEYIEDMEAIVTHHLSVYRRYQKCYPEQIIYYRDGVSDGQFPKISEVEVEAIREACRKLKIPIKLTCIIVMKRHHTRFFPLTQPRNERDFNNVTPGTVVDQHITHPNEKQFFMVSHRSVQGTARPARYNVIVDDSSYDINLLQKLTFNLCHMFPRCNSSVSYPAPAYLAHLVAFRGRVYLDGIKTFSKNLQSEYMRHT